MFLLKLSRLKEIKQTRQGHSQEMVNEKKKVTSGEGKLPQTIEVSKWLIFKWLILMGWWLIIILQKSLFKDYNKRLVGTTTSFFLGWGHH